MVSREQRVEATLVTPGMPLREAIGVLDVAGTGLLLLSSGGGILEAVLTDGDIRRHILAGGGLDVPCRELANREPLTIPPGATPAAALALLDHGRPYPVHHLPVVDPTGRVVDVLLRSDLVRSEDPAVTAVIMAGGYGTRLRPLTDATPKPMLPLGDRPLLERTVDHLRSAGIRRLQLTTHYLGDQIQGHFGDGSRFGVDIGYLQEEQPLGTAGALRLMPRGSEPVLVLNGDIVTNMDYRAMLGFHRYHQASLTVGVRRFDMQVPYGVVACEGPRVTAVHEKPVQHYLVNAGIYLIEPAALDHIPAEGRFDMTDLIAALLAADRRVVSFPVVEYWLDIARLPDYEAAQSDTLRKVI